MAHPPKLSHMKLRQWQDHLERAQVLMATVDMLLDVKAALHRTMDWAKITAIHIARMKP